MKLFNKKSERMMKISAMTILLLMSLFFFVMTMNGSAAPIQEEKNPRDAAPPKSWAFSRINITFNDDSTITYQRQTTVENSSIQDPRILHFLAEAAITTHDEILLLTRTEFPSTADAAWNNSLEAFRNSSMVEEYNRTFLSLQGVTLMDRDILGISNTVLEIFEFQQDNSKIFVIEQFFLIRETTAFIMGLQDSETFNFGRNSIQLGKLTDFQLHVFYSKEPNQPAQVNEEVLIRAPGGPLEYNSVTKGYVGSIHLTDFQPELLGSYERQFTRASQRVVLTFQLPAKQRISYGFDSEYTSKVDVSALETNKIHVEKNLATFIYDTGDWIPNTITINSVIPLLAQFEATDYLSWAVSGIIGIIATLKGLPVLFKRLSMGKMKKKLHLAATTGELDKIDQYLNEAREKFLKGKLSARQLENIEIEALMLKKVKTGDS